VSECLRLMVGWVPAILGHFPCFVSLGKASMCNTIVPSCVSWTMGPLLASIKAMNLKMYMS
jgi:hypothetical protein